MANTRYVLIDENSGFVWGDAVASNPIEACKIIDSNNNCKERNYEDIGFAHFDGRSGYHVHIASDDLPTDYDGQDAGIIDSVSAMPLTTRVAVAL